MIRRFVTKWLLVGGCIVPCFAQGQVASTVGDADVLAAIEAAKQGPRHAPYVLQSHPITTDPEGRPLDPKLARMLNEDPPTVYGALYTPFIRVALLAQNAFESYKPFTAAEVPAEVKDRMVFVVVRPYEKRTGGIDRFVDPKNVVLLPTGSRSPADAVQPAWIKTDTTVLQNAFGAKIEARSLIAAFAPEEIRAGRDFVFIYAGPLLDGPAYANLPPQQRLEIRPKDITRWR